MRFDICSIGRTIPFESRSEGEDSWWVKALAGGWLGVDIKAKKGKASSKKLVSYL